MEHLQSLDSIKGKVHYATISEEDWTGLSYKKVFSFARKYGVSAREVWRQVRGGNTRNRTFPIRHIVPHFLSDEELTGDMEALKRIVRERELDGHQVRKLRCQHNSRKDRLLRSKKEGSEVTSDSDTEPCEVPAAPPQLSMNDALTRVYETRSTSCFGLHLLVTVQNEDAAVCNGATPDEAGVRAHMRRLPMSVLRNLISELWQVREAWERDVLAPCAAALSNETAHTEEEKLNALFFHMCLWQRRYPLEMLLSVLSFHSAHRELFVPVAPAEPCEPYRVEQLLEELQRVHGEDLSDVPGLIRCDILMTYPKMPLPEQTELMRRVAAACRRNANADVNTPTAASGTEMADNWDALHLHSRSAPDPQLLLASVGPPDVAVPPRFCAGMSTDVYRRMRAAFERHKREGVRRLALLDYTRRRTPSADPVPSPEP